MGGRRPCALPGGLPAARRSLRLVGRASAGGPPGTGEEAEERKWVYFTEIAPIPVQDLQMLDKLWMTYSKGRYGFSVQKKIWKSCVRLPPGMTTCWSAEKQLMS